jgi:hypothetical protein
MAVLPHHSDAEMCRRQAAACREAARNTKAAKHRVMLERIAGIWLRMAEDVANDDRWTPVCAPPRHARQNGAASFSGAGGAWFAHGAGPAPFTAAGCRTKAEEKLAMARRGGRHCKRLIAAADAWLMLTRGIGQLEDRERSGLHSH